MKYFAISVIMPVYNYFIQETIDIIIPQIKSDFEFIINNFGLSDNSSEITFCTAISASELSISPYNTGYSPTFNIRIQQAKGEASCIMGAEDIFNVITSIRDMA